MLIFQVENKDVFSKKEVRDLEDWEGVEYGSEGDGVRGRGREGGVGHETDAEWVVNLKKGIINMLIIQIENEDVFSKKEVRDIWRDRG